MIKSLLISSPNNAGILKPVLKNVEHKSRVQAGYDWSLRRFIDCDLKNYMSQTHIVLDVSSFIEKDNEFVALLSELRQKNSKANVILYCAELTTGNLFLYRLVKVGFTNIIASYSNVSVETNCELMQADLQEALTTGLSEQKYSRFVSTNEFDFDADVTASKNSRLDFSAETRNIVVIGSQRRIGVTTFNMSLCRYVAENGGSAALILCCSDAANELEFMRNYFNAETIGGGITVNSVDIFTADTANELHRYNLVVYDCGDVRMNFDKLDEVNADAIYLCCGIGWKELHHVNFAHSKLNGLEYMAVVNADAETCETWKDVLCGGLNEYAAVDFGDSVAVGEVVFSA